MLIKRMIQFSVREIQLGCFNSFFAVYAIGNLHSKWSTNQFKYTCRLKVKWPASPYRLLLLPESWHYKIENHHETLKGKQLESSNSSCIQ